jgi:hypothetical protein
MLDLPDGRAPHDTLLLDRVVRGASVPAVRYPGEHTTFPFIYRRAELVVGLRVDFLPTSRNIWGRFSSAGPPTSGPLTSRWT